MLIFVACVAEQLIDSTIYPERYDAVSEKAWVVASILFRLALMESALCGPALVQYMDLLLEVVGSSVSAKEQEGVIPDPPSARTPGGVRVDGGPGDGGGASAGAEESNNLGDHRSDATRELMVKSLKSKMRMLLGIGGVLFLFFFLAGLETLVKGGIQKKDRYGDALVGGKVGLTVLMGVVQIVCAVIYVFMIAGAKVELLVFAAAGHTVRLCYQQLRVLGEMSEKLMLAAPESGHASIALEPQQVRLKEARDDIAAQQLNPRVSLRDAEGELLLPPLRIAETTASTTVAAIQGVIRDFSYASNLLYAAFLPVFLIGILQLSDGLIAEENRRNTVLWDSMLLLVVVSIVVGVLHANAATSLL